MHEMGAGWLMTTLTSSPVMVAMVQTATTLPIFILAIPAGALADIFDRRRYLLTAFMWMMGIATILGLMTLSGLITAWSLIALTFALGIGSSMMMPALASIVPELVPRDELQRAISINAIGINVSRAIGPAIAGVIISFYGSGVVFVLNAVSFLFVLIVIWRWKRTHQESNLPAERFISALRMGVRFSIHSSALQATLIRSFGFFFFACALWALLPLIAKDLLGGGPQTFGILMASIGIGAVLGALVLPWIRARLSTDYTIHSASIIYALALISIANFHHLLVTSLSFALFGASWITGISSMQVAAQLSLPNWVRSRGLAIMMTVFMGSMALGSILWGTIARETNISSALIYAAAGGVIAIGITWRWHIGGIEKSDLTASMHWDTPITHDQVTHDRSPVMIIIEYKVRIEQVNEFLRLIHELGRHRKRDGAYSWDVLESAKESGNYVETYMLGSWLEHLRQHERVTNEDRQIQEKIRRLLRDDESPIIRRFVGPQKNN